MSELQHIKVFALFSGNNLQKYTCKTAWEREDVSFARVGSVVLLRFPCWSNAITCSSRSKV